MNNLSIQLIVNPHCQLVAIDNTRYFNLTARSNDIIDSLLQHVTLEFLVYRDEEYPVDSTIIFKEYRHNRGEYGNNISTIIFPQDGIFTYYKFVIPKIEHLIKLDNQVIKMQDQIFYYNRKFYKGFADIEFTESSIEEVLNNHIDEIINNSEIVDNYLDIWSSIKAGNSTQTFSFQQIIFSMCKLQECLVNLQKKTLLDTKNCLECDTNTSIRYKRDFLLSALYVLDYLKDRKNYDEAQRILDNLSTCDNLCGDELNSNNNCGCGSTK